MCLVYLNNYNYYGMLPFKKKHIDVNTKSLFEPQNNEKIKKCFYACRTHLFNVKFY